MINEKEGGTLKRRAKETIGPDRGRVILGVVTGDSPGTVKGGQTLSED